MDDQIERVARTVSTQRTGDPERCAEFLGEVRHAFEEVNGQSPFTVRDLLDIGPPEEMDPGGH